MSFARLSSPSTGMFNVVDCEITARTRGKARCLTLKLEVIDTARTIRPGSGWQLLVVVHGAVWLAGKVVIQEMSHDVDDCSPVVDVIVKTAGRFTENDARKRKGT